MGGPSAPSARGVTDAPYTPFKPHEFRNMAAKTSPNLEAWTRHRENAHLIFKPGKATNLARGLVFGLLIPAFIYTLVKSDMQRIDGKEGRDRPFM
jgi:hypothetical protein